MHAHCVIHSHAHLLHADITIRVVYNSQAACAKKRNCVSVPGPRRMAFTTRACESVLLPCDGKIPAHFREGVVSNLSNLRSPARLSNVVH